jgi:hypothetical protein
LEICEDGRIDALDAAEEVNAPNTNFDELNFAGERTLVDSNVLLRWVKPDHSDYPIIVSATDFVLQHDGVLCYTSQNVAEFWNACTRPQSRNGYGLTPQDADVLDFSRKSSGCSRTTLRFTKSGAKF